MTAPDAREGLREVLADALVRSGQLMFDGGRYRAADALLPVVTDYVETQARARAAEVIARVKAVPAYALKDDDQLIGYVLIPDDVLDALAADDRTDAR